MEGVNKGPKLATFLFAFPANGPATGVFLRQKSLIWIKAWLWVPAKCNFLLKFIYFLLLLLLIGLKDAGCGGSSLGIWSLFLWLNFATNSVHCCLLLEVSGHLYGICFFHTFHQFPSIRAAKHEFHWLKTILYLNFSRCDWLFLFLFFNLWYWRLKPGLPTC